MTVLLETIIITALALLYFIPVIYKTPHVFPAITDYHYNDTHRPAAFTRRFNHYVIILLLVFIS